jgi:Acetyltransferase (GNAT) domain
VSISREEADAHLGFLAAFVPLEVILGCVAQVRDRGLPGAVRVVGPGDLPALVELTRDRGWSAGEAMWRLVLAAGDGFGIDAPAGVLAGAVAITRYPPGLVVARDDTTARALIHELATRASRRVRLDIPSPFTSLSRWASGRGLLPGAPDPVMASNGRPLPGARDQLYALVMQALG